MEIREKTNGGRYKYQLDCNSPNYTNVYFNRPHLNHAVSRKITHCAKQEQFLSCNSYLHLQYVYLQITRKTVANVSFLWWYKKQCTQLAEKCLPSTRVITAPSTSRINISTGAKCVTFHVLHVNQRAFK
jgi:hypothetical protein